MASDEFDYMQGLNRELEKLDRREQSGNPSEEIGVLRIHKSFMEAGW